MDSVGIITQILSGLTVITQGLLILAVVSFFNRKIRKIFFKKALGLSFIAALIATLGSLFYSEIAGYDPCKLCWLQRILMYPQVVILGIAWAIKDGKALYYTGVLSILGGIVAFLHYIEQITVGSSFSCSAIGYSLSCSNHFVMHFGYITIPMMALSVFALNFFLLLVYLRHRKKGGLTLNK